jgi:hypothetical protein
VFAPYTDVTLWPTPRLADVLAKTGADRLTLAFVVNDAQNRLSWGGVQPWNWPELIVQVKTVGADRFVCSVGGAAGIDPCVGNTNETDLLNQFTRLLTVFGFDTLDFDVEGSALENLVSVQRRNRLIRALNVAFPRVKIHFTLPVMPDGLDAAGVALVRDAVVQKCAVDVVNLMTMDYGSGVSDMGDAAVRALRATHNQIQAAGLVLGSGLGVCPMIGQNDVAGEVFTLGNARSVADFARATPWLTWLTFWSTARDNGIPGSLDKASNVKQEDFAFSKIFAEVQKV